MFNSITWELFVTSLLLTIVIYYSIATILLYHTEILNWIKTRSRKIRRSEELPSFEKTSVNSMMGAVQKESLLDQRTSHAAAEEIAVLSTNDTPEPISTPDPRTSDHLIIGSVSELLHDIGTVLQLVRECKSEKSECISLFKTLLTRYPHLRNTAFQELINQFIINSGKHHLSFELSIQEVSTWWYENTGNQNSLIN